jgi:hypothetical protein
MRHRHQYGHNLCCAEKTLTALRKMLRQRACFLSTDIENLFAFVGFVSRKILENGKNGISFSILVVRGASVASHAATSEAYFLAQATQ